MENLARLVIWGLRGSNHTHSHIHRAFFDTAKKLGIEAFWTRDHEKYQHLVTPQSVVFAMGDASKALPRVGGARYVLHNFGQDTELGPDKNILRLQVYTNSAKGTDRMAPRIIWDDGTRTLFQPWGTPYDRTLWKSESPPTGNLEYWVGSVWQNSLAQGNAQTIAKYKISLSDFGIKFRAVGGTFSSSRHWTHLLRPQVSDAEHLNLVARSRVGASVVGPWQTEAKLVPCRVFKNISAGKIVSSNSYFGDLFPGAIYEQDISILVDQVMRIRPESYLSLVREQQAHLANYTYARNLRRILDLF